MPLLPKRVKFRKSQRGMVRGTASRGNRVSVGEFGLQSLECAWISSKQIEAGRVAANHFLARSGRLIIRIFPHKSITAKPAETRMGTGKGEIEEWVAVVKPGTVLYELSGVPEDVAREALNRIAHKMPIKVRLVGRR